MQQLEAALVKTDKKDADIKKAVDNANEQRKNFLAAEDRPSDEKIIATTAMMFYNDIDKSQHPIGFYEDIKNRFGSLNDEALLKPGRKVFLIIQ